MVKQSVTTRLASSENPGLSEDQIYSPKKDHFENLSPFPDDVGGGFLNHMQISNKLIVIEGKQFSTAKMTGQSTATRNMFLLTNVLSGKIITRVENNDKIHIESNGQTSIYGTEISMRADIQVHEPFHSLVFLVDRSKLYPLLETHGLVMNKNFCQIIEGNDREDFYLKEELSPQLDHIAKQIINSPYHGEMKRIYLEAKSMEFIILRLESLLNETKRQNDMKGMKPGDIDKIHHARHIIEQRMTNPPSIHDLALEVQLNHNKLKYGFKQVFNNTIFGYLKEIRLEQARTLLLDERLSVTETAYTVGYNSLSHFAAAFHQKYGMNPGSIRK